MVDRLNSLRQKLDAIDSQIMDLLNQRADVAIEIAHVKDEADLSLTNTEREQEIFCKLRNRAKHPLLKNYVEEIFHPIFALSKQIRIFQCHQKLPFQDIGIIGVGLIGSSIARAIKMVDNDAMVIGIDSQLSAPPPYLDAVIEEIEELVLSVEVVIIASPLKTVVPIAKKLVAQAKQLNKHLLILDVASVKGEIAPEFEALSTKDIICIATHPMAGNEHKGNSSGKATLFTKAPWLIIAGSHITDLSLQQTKIFIQSIGAIPTLMNVDEHDKTIALISHLPGILATEYHRMVKEQAPQSLDIVGPGYRSFTRIAHSNKEMRKEIAKINKYQIDQWLEQFICRITHDKQ